MARVSGPLLDRIDIQIEVGAVPHRDLTAPESSESSDVIRDRVTKARRLQEKRFSNQPGIHANAHMGPSDLRRHCHISSSAEALVGTAIVRLKLSARAYHRILKISRTIADLAESATIEPAHVSEAVQYRSLDRTTG